MDYYDRNSPWLTQTNWYNKYLQIVTRHIGSYIQAVLLQILRRNLNIKDYITEIEKLKNS